MRKARHSRFCASDHRYVNEASPSGWHSVPRTGYPPSPIEIAEHLCLEPKDVLDALEAIEKRCAASLDQPIEIEAGADLKTKHDLIGVDEEGYALGEMTTSLCAALRQLPPLDRRVTKLRRRAASHASAPTGADRHRAQD